jgi:hypothetical protein
MALTFKKFEKCDLYPGMLKSFNRYQEVNKVWRKSEKGFIVIDSPFTENWDEALKMRLYQTILLLA